MSSLVAAGGDEDGGEDGDGDYYQHYGDDDGDDDNDGDYYKHFGDDEGYED